MINPQHFSETSYRFSSTVTAFYISVSENKEKNNTNSIMGKDFQEPNDYELASDEDENKNCEVTNDVTSNKKPGISSHGLTIGQVKCLISFFKSFGKMRLKPTFFYTSIV